MADEMTCRAATKHGHGRQCLNPASRDGYCETHYPGADAAAFGVSRDERWRMEQIAYVKALLAERPTDGLTLAQVGATLPVGISKATREDFEQELRRDPDIAEDKERRVNAAGRMQIQVVLRLARSGELPRTR
jgi:hypothetical protein